MGIIHRRQFLAKSGRVAAGVSLGHSFPLIGEVKRVPDFRFPSAPSERLAVASWPFRAEFESSRLELKDFPAQVVAKFQVRRVELWSGHFRSFEAQYLREVLAATKNANAMIVNIAVDCDHSYYDRKASERKEAIEACCKWIDVASAIDCPSIRTSIAHPEDSHPDAARIAESLAPIVEYAVGKGIVVNLENDSLISEDPFFLSKVIQTLNSPWLRALPDFANTLLSARAAYAYKGLQTMFRHAYNMCHVKELENDDNGKLFRADLGRTMKIAKDSGYKGYFSIEWSSTDDPYAGTAALIQKIVRYLS
jgi:sugar phosphate isomerase/epimerase